MPERRLKGLRLKMQDLEMLQDREKMSDLEKVDNKSMQDSAAKGGGENKFKGLEF